MKKIILIAIIAIVLVGLIVAFIKFVGRMTPGNSVIKKYSYSGDVNDFISHVRNFSIKDSNIVSKITDTTGTVQKGYTYYMSIELKNHEHDILYSIACESKNTNAASGTFIELVMAYDKINNIGGYNKEAKGIKPLVNNFDVNFITPLRNAQNIKITPL